MTLSRLELGFESPWGRQSHKTAGENVVLQSAENTAKTQ